MVSEKVDVAFAIGEAAGFGASVWLRPPPVVTSRARRSLEKERTSFCEPAEGGQHYTEPNDDSPCSRHSESAEPERRAATGRSATKNLKLR